MTPKPYSDKSPLPIESSNDGISGIATEVLPQTPSPGTLSGASTPSPTPQEQVPVETFVEAVHAQESNRMTDIAGITPCYPTPADIMPYDHSLPDFIRQITNEPNLGNLQSLSLRVISTLISLHRMAAYLPNLRELDLEGSVLNSLRDIGCNLKNLQILKVGRCQLESLDGTFGLSSLRELYAQKNFINDVSPCSNLPHIRHIDVSGNRIRNISYAGFLSVCRKLKSIVFSGNPAADVSGYRNHVRRILPQIETLDGVSFINEGGAEVVEPELIENYCGNSDSGSEVPDFPTVSPREGANDLSKSEDWFLLDKKHKQEKNLANQDQSDAGDSELPEACGGESQDRILARNGFLGQAKATDNRSINLKQKCARIQKQDKDIENRSKKSNSLLNANFGEEFVSSQQFSRSQLSEEDNADFPSTSAPASGNDDSKKFTSLEEEPTGQRPVGSTSNFPIQEKEDEANYDVIKKKPSPSSGKSKEEEEVLNENWGMNKLTTGLPICGNLTAALRNRKKLQSGWGESQNFLHQNAQSPNEAEDLKPEFRGSGDATETECGAPDEDDIIGEDVLTTSRKWRQSFRRFRSNNRASWEEEDED